MNLSTDLISQFVKITNDAPEKKHETTCYGTVVESDGVKYVRLDGSDIITPVNTTVDMRNGERVTVLLKNHTATVTGNLSSPAIRTGTVNDELDSVRTEAATKEELAVEQDRIDKLEYNVNALENLMTIHAGDTEPDRTPYVWLRQVGESRPYSLNI